MGTCPLQHPNVIVNSLFGSSLSRKESQIRVERRHKLGRYSEYIKMFRESDYQYPVLHPTYVRKPVPELQLKSTMSHLEDRQPSAREKCVATIYDDQPPVVPVTTDCKFDPSHPDADWAGLRSLNRVERKHCADHRSQRIHLVQESDGIIGRSESKIIQPKRVIIPEASRDRDGEPLIGGIDVKDHFKTTYQQLLDHDTTSREQLTLQKRMLPKRQLSPRLHAENCRINSNTNPYGNISGFYQPPSVSSNKSLLSNMGATLVTKRF